MADQTAQTRLRVEGDILRILLDELEKGQLSLSEAQAVATETLATIDKVNEQSATILAFYQSLARRFPVFEVLYTRAKEGKIKEEELAAYRQALASVEAGKIEEARKIIDSALAKTVHEATNTN